MAADETSIIKPKVKIKVFGVGGGGNSVLMRMGQHNDLDIELVAVNTDAKQLSLVAQSGVKPMQIGELERVLAGSRDWTGIRERVRTVVMEQSITQARVDYLRAQVIALQAEGLRPISDDGEAEHTVLLEKLNEQGTTVLVVTHNKDLVNRLGKRVITMHRGAIAHDVEEGSYVEA